MDASLTFDRFKPSQLVYVELDSTNGGMLLSASEEGFCFRAVTPLRPSGPVAFSLLLDAKTRLEGKGKMVWSEEEGRTGGILFTEVTPQFRREFETWLRRKESRKGIAEGKTENRPESKPEIGNFRPPLAEPKSKVPHAPPEASIAPPLKAAPAPPAAPKLPHKETSGKTSSVPLLEDLERALKNAAMRAEKLQPAAPPPVLPSRVPPEKIAPEQHEEPPMGVRPTETKLEKDTTPGEAANSEEAAKPNVTVSLSEPSAFENPPATLPPTIRAEAPSAIVSGKEAEEGTGKIPEASAADTMEKVARGFRQEFVPESKTTDANVAPAPEIPAPKITESSAELPRVELNLAAPLAVSVPEPESVESKLSEPESISPQISAIEIERASVASAETIAAREEKSEAATAPAKTESAAPAISPPTGPQETLARADIAQNIEEFEIVPDAELELAWKERAGAKRHWGRAGATAFVCVCIVWTLALLGFEFRRPLGEEMMRLGQKIAGEGTPAGKSLPADIPKQNSAPASSVSQQPASDSATPEKSVPENPAEGEVKPAGTEPDNSGTAAAGTTDGGKSGTSSAEKAGNAEPEAAAVAAAPAMKVSATGQKEFEEARKILHGEHRTKDMEKAVEFLLASVSRGNVRAEVTLGDLYARGDGVPRDCGQARILLEAAVKKGSPEARRLLGKLKSQGCP